MDNTEPILTIRVPEDELVAAAGGTIWPPEAFALVDDLFRLAERTKYGYDTKVLWLLDIDLGCIFGDDYQVSSEAVCWEALDEVLARWGLMAPAVLTQWNIRSSWDIGRIVEALADAGCVYKKGLCPVDRSARLASCWNLYRFDDVFVPAECIEVNLESNRALTERYV